VPRDAIASLTQRGYPFVQSALYEGSRVRGMKAPIRCDVLIGAPRYDRRLHAVQPVHERDRQGRKQGAAYRVQRVSFGCTGKVKVKMAPVGCPAVARNVPPWAPIIDRQIDRPMPKPVGFVV
jgi:hypothetical protein